MGDPLMTPEEMGAALGPGWEVDRHTHAGLTYWRRGPIVVTYYQDPEDSDGSPELWVTLDAPTSDQAGEVAVGDPGGVPNVIALLEAAVQVANGAEVATSEFDQAKVLNMQTQRAAVMRLAALDLLRAADRG